MCGRRQGCPQTLKAGGGQLFTLSNFFAICGVFCFFFTSSNSKYNLYTFTFKNMLTVDEMNKGWWKGSIWWQVHYIKSQLDKIVSGIRCKVGNCRGKVQVEVSANRWDTDILMKCQSCRFTVNAPGKRISSGKSQHHQLSEINIEEIEHNFGYEKFNLLTHLFGTSESILVVHSRDKKAWKSNSKDQKDQTSEKNDWKWVKNISLVATKLLVS